MPNNLHVKANPHWIIVKTFVVLIAAGTLLLWLPLSNRTGEWTNPLTALFTATSAMCVTGHTVVEIHSFFSLFGQLVILFLIQLGGLGFMTMIMFLMVLLKRRISIRNEMALTDSLGSDRAHDLRSILLHTIIFAFAFEAIGALIIMACLMVQHGYAFPRAAYYGVFHSVSAFCNAGFVLFPNNLIDLRQDKIILFTIAALIMIGGLGFFVLHDLRFFKFWRRNSSPSKSISLHTRIVLRASLFLILVGWCSIAFFEWQNTLAPLDVPDRLASSFFQSVTCRTAGFTTIDISQASAPTRFMTMILMFIGGSPGSAAGGIKTTTAVILLFSAFAMIRGQRAIIIHGRTMPVIVIEKATSIFMLGIMIVLISYGTLLLTEAGSLASAAFTTDALLFETISAFGTVGLTTGIMPDFSDLGKVVILICMFIGRISPLTIALLVSMKEKRQLVRYPEEEIITG